MSREPDHSQTPGSGTPDVRSDGPSGSQDPRQKLTRLVGPPGDDPGIRLDASAMGRAQQAVEEEKLPETVGPWQILRKLGQGGFGVVYLGKQSDPPRYAAVKLVIKGMDVESVLRRFDAERQALAVLSHPNIAGLLDAGTHGDRPYFAMEYVEGSHIVEYADRQKLTIPARLRLFQQVCAAVRHAHLKSIVHRDLSGKNVMVTEVDGSPVVKVIDFGIAKALNRGLPGVTLELTPGIVVGNYAYMSPEQIDPASDVDTRTDVYSLGVLLYELLAGERPFDDVTIRAAGEEGIRKLIREVDPPNPSTRLSTRADAAEIAGRRRLRAASLLGTLRGELEWIPMMAVRKERDRRYQSVAELSEDIGNYLDGRPLLAGPESRVYRVGKFASKHRASISVAAAFVAVLCGALAVTANALANETRASKEAAEQARAFEGLADFMGALFDAGDPGKGGRRDAGVQDLIKLGVSRVDAGQLRDMPAVDARVRLALASLTSNFGDARLAIRLLDDGARSKDFIASLDPATASAYDSRRALARLWGDDPHLTLEAAALARDAVSSAERSNDPAVRASAYYVSSLSHSAVGDAASLATAVLHARRSIDEYSRLADPAYDTPMANAEYALAEAYRASGDLTRARDSVSAAINRVERAQSRQGKDLSTRVAAYRMLLGDIESDAGNYDRAAQIYEVVEQATAARYGPGEIRVMSLTVRRAEATERIPGRSVESLALYERAKSGYSASGEPVPAKVEEAIRRIKAKLQGPATRERGPR